MAAPSQNTAKQPFFDVWFIDDNKRTRTRGTAFQRAVAWVTLGPVILLVIMPILGIVLAVDWAKRVRS